MNCSDCATPISRCSKGRCRKCALAFLNSNPEVHARRVSGIRRKYQTDPAYRQRKTREIGERHRKARECPETAARLNRNIWIARARLDDPGVREKFLAGRKEAGMKRTQTVLAWCPPDKIAEYRRLTKSKRLHAAEAKQIILDSLTPFERQMQKVRDGAALVEVRPFNRRADPAYSLTGCAAGMVAL